VHVQKHTTTIFLQMVDWLHVTLLYQISYSYVCHMANNHFQSVKFRSFTKLCLIKVLCIQVPYENLLQTMNSKLISRATNTMYSMQFHS